MKLDKKRQELLTLLEKCPVNEDNPQDCPLHSVRKNDTQAQLEWVTELSDTELSGVFSYHNTCYSRKIRKKD